LQHQTADLGLMIGEKSIWGKGFGQDAWNTLLRRALRTEGLRKISAGTPDCNRGMRKVIERSGMLYEGSRKEHELIDGVPQDIHYFGCFKSDL